MRQYRKDKPEIVAAAQKASSRRQRDIAHNYIRRAKSKPCADCNRRYPHYVMEFDHVRGVKLFSVNVNGSTPITLSRLEAEIAKCDVVCSNCHRARTWRRVHEGRSGSMARKGGAHT